MQVLGRGILSCIPLKDKSGQLKLIQSFDLPSPYPTVLPPRGVTDLFGYLCFPGSFTYGRPLTEKNLRFLEFIDDSLLRVASSGHLHISFSFVSLVQ